MPIGLTPAMTEAAPIRRRNAGLTKAKILAAAKQHFATHGYTNSSIRDVAAAAGVSYAMLGRYFGSKSELFAAAVQDSASMDVVSQFDRSTFGESLTKIIIERMGRDDAFAMSLLTASDPEGHTVALGYMKHQVIEPLSRLIEPPAEREKAVAITMLVTGFCMHVHHLPLIDPGMTIDVHHPLARWFAKQVQNILDNPELA